MSPTDGPQQLTDRLYLVPPAMFVAARDEAVSAARRAGDRAAATAIAKLRRPSTAAWLVNLLALRRPDQLDELLSLGARMRAAQQELRGPDMRELATRRRAAISDLVGQAVDLAVAAGVARGGLPVPEVEATLSAAVAREADADAVRSGRLVKPLRYAGFGDPPHPRLRVVPAGSSSQPADSPQPPPPGESGAAAAPIRRARPSPADALDAARQAADDAMGAVAVARSGVDEAAGTAAAAAEHLAGIEARLMDLRRERADAQRAARAAEAAHLAAAQALDAAKRAQAMAERAADRAARRAR